jgi:hypothetical protein
MTCERYWRDGIVLVERGLDDPHRDGCADCTRAHASRQELIEALPRIGAGDTGDPNWQASVWRRIDDGRAPARAPWRWRWQLAGALALACVVALWIGLGRTRPGEGRPQIDIFAGGGPMRSPSAVVGDRLRVTVGETSDVWIYRADRLVLQCHARQVSEGCAPDSDGMIVEMVLAIAGTYQVIIVEAPPKALPGGGLDEDRAALESAGIRYGEHPVTVR